MRAQIISIGSELILGHLTDTNATFLAQQLAGLGIELTLVTQVGDDLARLAATVEHSISDSDVVVCTGGIGPTADDLTREAIAQVVHEQPEVDPQLLDTIRAFFRARGLEMPERNAKQAWLIPSAEALPNPVGTAPGWFVKHDGHVIAAMPGVPREMFRMWREQVVPRLLVRQPGQAVKTTTIRTIGIGESAAEQVLRDLVEREMPVVATYAKDDGVHIRVTATAEHDGIAERVRDQTVAEVISRLAAHVYGLDDMTLPRSLAADLANAGASMSIADSGGGGRFASMLASDPTSAALIVSTMMHPQHHGQSAYQLARSASEVGEGPTLGVGVAVAVEPIGDDVFEGSITVALAGAVAFEEVSTIRSGFEDIQRRSALVAADVLRKGLQTIS
jgi:nicotinamide-nucleotide amidase